MALYPKAEKRLLPENRTEPYITATQFFFHSIVGSAEGAYGYFLRFTSLESHFIVKKNGDSMQLIDTARQADAQYRANIRGISVETEDNGRPDSDPWTAQQIDTLVDLGRWVAKTHNIPRRIMPRWDAPGFGWHAMFGAPSPLTPVSGKTCPGRIRIQQLHNKVLPAIFADVPIEEVDVVTKAEREAITNDIVTALTKNTDFLNAVAKHVVQKGEFNLHSYWGDEGDDPTKPNPERVNVGTGISRAAQAADEARDTIIGPVMQYLQRLEAKVNELSRLIPIQPPESIGMTGESMSPMPGSELDETPGEGHTG